MAKIKLMNVLICYANRCILKDRATYLIERGGTLNNFHIPRSYFKEWEKITENHAARLRKMVKDYIDNQ